MAVPTRKMSRANTRSRRANWKATPVAVQACPACGANKQSHMACPACGTYNGRHYGAAERTEHQA